MRKPFLTLFAVLLLVMFSIAGCSSEKPVDQPAASEQASASMEPVTESASGQPSEASQEPAPVPESTPAPLLNWEIVRDVKIDHKTNVEGFLDEDFGITVGYAGEIHYSNDGGKTWPRAENASMCRFSLDIVDENLAWCGGNGGNVRVSKDGGKTWTAVTDIALSGMQAHINFIDDTTGWIASSARFASTNDGGVTWTELTLPEGAKGISAIFLRTALEGYLLSLEGILYKTVDGGVTWTKQDLGFVRFGLQDLDGKPRLNKSSVPLAEINFTDENNGIVAFIGVVPGKGYKTWCLTTTDGGASWAEEEISPAEGFSATTLFLTKDGKYLTLSSNDKRVILLKRK